MPLSEDAIKKILEIQGTVHTTAEGMARDLVVTFFPSHAHQVSPRVMRFGLKLQSTFRMLGAKVIDFESSLEELPRGYFIKRYIKAAFLNGVIVVKQVLGFSETRPFITLRLLSQIRRGKKIRRGIAVIALGEGTPGNLPMDHVASFSQGNIVTVIDMPDGISESTSFEEHFHKALNLFAHHVTNIVIGVSDTHWILYNFNASHPIYPLDKDFEKNLLHSLIPKLAAPIRPPRLKDFRIIQNAFDVNDDTHKLFIDDLIHSGQLLQKTGLYPPGRKIKDLPFRNELYHWMGRVHLDERNGMSYGFLARQMSVSLPEVITKEEALIKYQDLMIPGKDYFVSGQNIFLIIGTAHGEYVLLVPSVWVLTQRSGSDKTKVNPQKDIVKMGLVNGKMILETPRGLRLTNDYKPSFDTKVILAHALGNAIFAAIAKKLDPYSRFAKTLETNGMAISHWHGYINHQLIPAGWYVHGIGNPTVSCSSAQSAIYAFQGKEEVFMESIRTHRSYHGDIHVEPQHGTNITFDSLKELGEYLNSRQDISALGNKYFFGYR